MLLGGGCLRRRVGGVERWLLPGSIGLAIDDEVVGGVFESVDGALREQHVVEHGEPLGGVAVARDDHRGASGALQKELIDVLLSSLLIGSSAKSSRMRRSTVVSAII